ncbi:MAG: type II toxin-antitoxin system RelE/ParE family toxin [Sphingomonas sp.]
MPYSLSRKAEEDIIDVYVWSVAEFGIGQADRYHAGLEHAFRFISENPHATRERSEIEPPVRAYRYRSHLVVYRVDGADVMILRVRHGREDWTHRD